jgi:photosystem II stability/assembly factor-like uncharacterized protein
VPVSYQDSTGNTGVVLLRSTDGGKTWSAGAPLSRAVDVSALSGLSALALRLGAYDLLHPSQYTRQATLWRTDDGGASWRPVAKLSTALKRQLGGVQLFMAFVNSGSGFIWAAPANAVAGRVI